MTPEDSQNQGFEEIERARLFKQSLADSERDSYLQKLKDKHDRRQTVRDLTDKATLVRAQHAQNASKIYLTRISRRSEFRSAVKKTFLEAHKFHEEALRLLGQQYREKLIYMVGRTLDARPPRMPEHKPLDLDSPITVDHEIQKPK
jgi:DNA-binding MarR family transcriptional regulator